MNKDFLRVGQIFCIAFFIWSGWFAIILNQLYSIGGVVSVLFFILFTALYGDETI